MKSCNCAESAKLRADLATRERDIAASNARADAAERRLSRFSADGHHLCEEAESLLTAERAETERLRSTVRVLCLEIDALRAARDSSARARGEPAEDVSALQADDLNARVLTPEQRTMFGVQPAPAQAPCSGLTAAHCPRCGDCTCPDRETVGHLDSELCPLHSSRSDHAAQPAPAQVCPHCGNALDPGQR